GPRPPGDSTQLVRDFPRLPATCRDLPRLAATRLAARTLRPTPPALACCGCTWHFSAAAAWARRSPSGCSTGAGMPTSSPAAISPGQHASELDLEVCERVLGGVGIVVRVPESQLDAVTGLSGSGPAYVFLVAEAMIEAGVLVGLPRATSEQLVRQTLLGAA